MLRWQKRLLKDAFILIDFIAIFLSVLVCILLTRYNNNEIYWQKSAMEIIGFYSVVSFVYIFMFIMLDIYKPFMSHEKVFKGRLIIKLAFAFFVGYFLTYGIISKMLLSYSHTVHLFFAIPFFILSIFLKGIIHVERMHKDNLSEIKRNLLLIGQSGSGIKYEEVIGKYEYLNYNIIGYLNIKSAPNITYLSTDTSTKVFKKNLFPSNQNGNKSKTYCYKSALHLGNLKDLDEVLNSYVVDELVVTRPLSYCYILEEKLKHCQERGITITMLLNRQCSDAISVTVSMIEDIPAVKFHTVSLNESQKLAKRMLDILGASVGMVIFGISWIIFAPLIKLESKGPVLFKQVRVGKNGRLIKLWKYRTMCEDAEVMKKELESYNEIQGSMFKITNDPRVTRIGRFMRKTSIDEIPQFFNVLVGDMSLVGTRPPTVDEVKKYETHHYKRISIIPGMSGMWQVSGRSNIRNFEEIVKLDNQYIHNWTIWKDIEIIAKTFVVLTLRKGAH